MDSLGLGVERTCRSFHPCVWTREVCVQLRELAADCSRYRVEEIYRDCKIAEIYEGTNEIQKLVIARAIFGKDATG